MTRTRTIIGLVVLLLITLLATSFAAAEGGCCVEQQTDSTSSYVARCVDEGELSIYNYQASADFCLGGDWRPDTACNALPIKCTTGCCCGEKGGYWETLKSACIKPDTFYVGEADCASICDPTSEKFNVTGIVHGPDNTPLPNINVTIDIPSILQVTNSTGEFRFEDVPGGNNILTANNETCEVIHYFYIRKNVDNINLTLECSSTGTGTGECQPQWDCTYNDDTTCGSRYDNCIDNSGCTQLSYTNYYPGRQLPFKPCPLITTTCVNDGTVDEDNGENCDNYEGTVRFGTDVNQLCSDYGNYVGEDQVSCTNCRVDTTNCEICPQAPAAYCTEQQCQECETVCGDLCTQYDCLDQKPVFTKNDISFPEGEDNVGITWNFPPNCLDNVQSFTIQRCTGSDCGEDDMSGNIRLDRHNQKNVFSTTTGTHYYKITGLEPETTYCFRIVANIKEGDMTAITNSGEFHCKTTGITECMQQHPAKMCDDDTNTIVECDENNLFADISSCDDLTCYDSEETGNAVCADSTACDQCNGLFGMYSYLSSKNPFSIPFFDAEEANTYPLRCDSTRIINPTDNIGNYLPLCQQTKSPTTADKLSPCDEVNSCYDYTTKNSCVNDYCHSFNNGACKWNEFPAKESFSSLSAQTGLGVCVPKDQEAVQECGRCNEDNNVLPACTQTLCYLYNSTPNGCLFKKTSAYTGECISKAESSCNSYGSEAECEGKEPYELDVTYNKETMHEDERISGTNKRLVTSNDHFKFGTCQWVNNSARSYCIKNADAYVMDSHNPRDDCGSVRDDYPACDHDFEPPVTTLTLIDAKDQPWEKDYPVYSAKELFTYDVTDNLLPREALDTWFGLATTGKNAYPDTDYETFIQNLSKKNGVYNITYYSADASKNLELTNWTKLGLDNTPPVNVSFSVAQSWFRIAEDEYRTNATITHDYTDPHGPISCNTTLNSGISLNLGGDRNFQSVTSGATLTNNYYGLPDDTYTFTATCTDHPFLNNSITYNKYFVVEADKSITDPQPTDRPSPSVYTTRDSPLDINISIKTETKVQYCKYVDAETSNKPLNSDSGKNFTINNTNLQHNDTLHFNDTSPSMSSIHFYHVGCNFTSGNVTQGNRADMIKFSIDNSAPETTLLNAVTGENYNETTRFYTEQVELTFARTDDVEDLLMYTASGVVYYNGTAGVQATYYCRNDNEAPRSCSPFRKWLGEMIEINDTNIDDGHVLHYYSVDTVGNVEKEHQQPIYVKNLDVLITGVRVCTSDNVCYTETNPVVT